MLIKILLLSAGGALGALFRYGLGGFIYKIAGTHKVCLTATDSRGTDSYCYDLPVTVGVRIRPDINPVELYPNPAENYIVLRLDEADVETYHYAEVFDIYGRLVMKTRLERRSPGHVRIDLDNMNPGLYTIRINAERKTYVGQFLTIDR